MTSLALASGIKSVMSESAKCSYPSEWKYASIRAVDALLEVCLPTQFASERLIASALPVWSSSALSLTHDAIFSESLFAETSIVKGELMSPFSLALSPFDIISVAICVPSDSVNEMRVGFLAVPVSEKTSLEADADTRFSPPSA